MTTQSPLAIETAGRHYAYLRTKVSAAAAANDGVPLEDHLRAPVQALVESVAEDLGYPKLVLAGEISGAVAGARPDYTVMRGGLIIWRSLLFPEASDAEFADAYAQTITFGLIAARAAGSALTAGNSVAGRVAQATSVLDADVGLIPTALRVLCSESAIGPIEPAVESLLSLLAATDPALLNDAGDWLYFYEDFLAQYDPDLRKESGSYYTPAELVQFMVRLVDEVLRTRLGQPSGFADEAVTVIDPAVGTGTFLRQIIDRIASTVEERDGAGAVAGALRGAAERLVGFELQTGPYSVAQFRTGARFRRHGVDRAPPVLLADTLADPYTEEVRLGSIYEPISRERRAANHLKATTPVTVAIGNPPYRERAKGLGGWVESGNPNTDLSPILNDWKPPTDWEVSAHVKNMSNLLVYFWRWATWKVLENSQVGLSDRLGVVCFVTTAPWLSGDGFQKMRAWLRQQCSEIWVVSLSPEGHQPDVRTRIFQGVQHEIAVVCAVRSPQTDELPAAVRFQEVAPGSRSAKFTELDRIKIASKATQPWIDCPNGWREPFKPAGMAIWRSCPAIHDLLPWSASGVLAQRGWPTSADPNTLQQRWDELVGELNRERKRTLFQKTDSRTIDWKSAVNLPGCPPERSATPIAQEKGPCPTPIRLGRRSFDRQWIIPDKRVLDRPAPSLWETWSDRQVHLTCIEDDHPDNGPAVTFTHLLPGLHHYHGRGGRAFPLWRDNCATTANVAPKLLDHLGKLFGTDVAPEDLLAYVAGVCAHPTYTAWFNEVSPHTPGIRVPLTADGDYWSMASAFGRRVIWAHTFGERYVDTDDGRPPGRIRLSGGPRLRSETGAGTYNRTLDYDAEQQELRIGDGVFKNVSPEVDGYEVSGKNVIRTWFNYRRSGTGNRDQDSLESITPDGWRPEWDIELLDILNALTALVVLEPEQAELLAAIIDGPQITVEDLTTAEVLPVPAEAKKAPKVEKKATPAQTTLV
ncbi:MAG: N-6 DNA methylase [Acidimicrobiia bacterium]|nr:N-6 DNA methylase [Acidimicrobiia bacterium]MYC44023.1 N-6 DNA methylase [Acidimicrobiia bacterium]MYI20881.1 N-6 DNA methylase [Acidimicrobiia bacterium]